MKWYRTVPCGNPVDDPLVCDTSNLEDYYFEQWKYRVQRAFYQGKPMESWPDDIYLTTKNEEYDGTPDDSLQNRYMIPVFSERLVHAIKEEKIDGFQFIPIMVYGYERRTEYRYYIANCINACSALNHELSVYHQFPHEIVCQKIILNSNGIDKYDVFRLSEQLSVLMVSERFVKMFHNNKFTGYSFQPIKVV